MRPSHAALHAHINLDRENHGDEPTHQPRQAWSRTDRRSPFRFLVAVRVGWVYLTGIDAATYYDTMHRMQRLEHRCQAANLELSPCTFFTAQPSAFACDTTVCMMVWVLVVSVLSTCTPFSLAGACIFLCGGICTIKRIVYRKRLRGFIRSLERMCDALIAISETSWSRSSPVVRTLNTLQSRSMGLKVGHSVYRHDAARSDRHPTCARSLRMQLAKALRRSSDVLQKSAAVIGATQETRGLCHSSPLNEALSLVSLSDLELAWRLDASLLIDAGIAFLYRDLQLHLDCLNYEPISVNLADKRPFCFVSTVDMTISELENNQQIVRGLFLRGGLSEHRVVSEKKSEHATDFTDNNLRQCHANVSQLRPILESAAVDIVSCQCELANVLQRDVSVPADVTKALAQFYACRLKLEKLVSMFQSYEPHFAGASQDSSSACSLASSPTKRVSATDRPVEEASLNYQCGSDMPKDDDDSPPGSEQNVKSCDVRVLTAVGSKEEGSHRREMTEPEESVALTNTSTRLLMEELENVLAYRRDPLTDQQPDLPTVTSATFEDQALVIEHSFAKQLGSILAGASATPTG